MPRTAAYQDARSRSTRTAAAWAPRLLLVAAMLLGAGLGTLTLTATVPVVPASAPPNVFSAARAQEDLAMIAAAPHPVGSPAQAAVRDYLLGEIAALGLTPEVQRTTVRVVSPLSGIAQVTPVENVLVRLPGTGGRRGPGQALLLTGHYDSVPTSPGAGDCGSCAATVLETLRAVVAQGAAGAPLANDVIFLFTDAEELGIVGAQAFVDAHPWAAAVGLSIVLEGLGTHGSSLVYAAAPNQGAAVRAAFGAVQAPGGFAYIHDLMWKISGNSGSDLDAFVAGGKPGLVFVHLSLDGSQSYHSGGDNVAALDGGTLQQHGDQALSLVRYFGGADLTALAPTAAPEGEAVYFTLLPRLVVHYPGAWALPLALLAALSALAAVIYGWRRRAFTLWGLLGGLLAALLGLILAVALGTAVWYLLRQWNPNLHMYAVGGWYGAAWTTGGLVVLTLALLAALHALWRRRLGVAALAAGGLLWYAALALLAAPGVLGAGLPGFGYLFTFPLLLAAPVAAYFWSPRPTAAVAVAAAVGSENHAQTHPWVTAALLGVPAVAVTLLLAPVVYGMGVFAQRIEAMTALPLLALPLPLVALAWALLAEQAEFVAGGRRGALAAVLLAAAVALLAVGWAQSGFDTAHPRLNTIVYQLDADGGEAQWITVDDARSGRGTTAQLDGWTAQFFPTGAEATRFNPWPSGWFTAEYPALAGPAPVVDLPRSAVRVVEAQGAGGGGRLLLLEIAPPAGVQDLFVEFRSEPGVAIRSVDGEALDGTPAPSVRLNVNGHPTAPVRVELAAGAGPVQVRVQERRLGLPAVSPPIAPRPAWMAAAPFNDVSDSTLVVHSITIE
jgi:hypothetical protein